jgi:hypothetical protein
MPQNLFHMQTSRSAAEGKQEEAKQMSLDAAAVLMLAPCQSISSDTAWQLVRPLLRLHLWLVPAHIPLRSVQPAALMQQPAGSPLAGATPEANWKADLGAAYACNVATVSAQMQLQSATCPELMACQDVGMLMYISVALCMQPALAQAALTAVKHALRTMDPETELDSLPYSQAAMLLEQTVGLLTLVHRYAQQMFLPCRSMHCECVSQGCHD